MKAIRPYFTVEKAAELIEFYKVVFHAEVIGDVLYLDNIPGFETHKGKVGHAELKIGESHLYVSELLNQEQNYNNSIHLIFEMDSIEELKNCHEQLIEEGVEYQEPSEQSWCELTSYARDKFGISWSLFYNLK